MCISTVICDFSQLFTKRLIFSAIYVKITTVKKPNRKKSNFREIMFFVK